MSIASATQNGTSVKVYSEKGAMMFSRPGELVGYTSTTVSIREGNSVKTYDDKGKLKFSRPSK